MIEFVDNKSEKEKRMERLAILEERIVALSDKYVSGVEQQKAMWDKIDGIVSKLTRIEVILSENELKRIQNHDSEINILKVEIKELKRWKASFWRIFSPIFATLLSSSIIGGLLYFLKIKANLP